MRPLALLDALDAHRLGLTALVAGLPPATVRRRPVPGAWSLAQVLDHLVRVDGVVDLGAPRGTPAGRATSPLRAGLVRGVLALPVRVPAPPGAGRVMPGPDPDPGATLAAWAALRADWRRALEAMPRAEWGRMAFRHPLAGAFAVPDALAFVLAHHRHHDAQVRRTLRALGA